MTTTGILTAKPTASRYANLTATTRIGTSRNNSAIWQLACSCGSTLSADAREIRRGAARCPICNPPIGKDQENRILVVLPATLAKIVRKTKLTYGQVKHRIACMRKAGACHVGGWDRAETLGSFAPILFAGEGKDVPCTLKARTPQQCERRYTRRIKRAFEQVDNGGKENPRYARQIALHKADQTAKRTRKEPQGPFAALFAGRLPLNAEG
jgi:hypothetical protein